MQRFVLLAIVGFNLAAFAMAADYQLGERVDGDVLVATRNTYRPAVPGKSMIAMTGHSGRDLLTAIEVVNGPGSDGTISIIKGGIGFNYATVQVKGAVGQVLDVSINFYTAA